MHRDRRRPGRALVLHLGAGKTGTSSIQSWFHRNREALSERGVCYPLTPGPARHVRLGFAVRPRADVEASVEWRRSDLGDHRAFRRTFTADLLAEVAAAPDATVVMSDEALYSGDDATLTRLRRLAARISPSVRAVVYLRRQDDHLVSRYQQSVKTGAIERLTDFAKLDHTDAYDYHARLTRIERRLRPGALVVRRFESPRFGPEGLIGDFLDAAALDLDRTGLLDVAPQNESLDAEAVEFLRLYNLFRVRRHGATPGVINNRRLFLRLAVEGPTLTLPEADLESFMAQWSLTNDRVATDFLGESEGPLFEPRRARTGVTTHQVLPPERLDHYLDLLEIPEKRHAGLRRLVEREATSGEASR